MTTLWKCTMCKSSYSAIPVPKHWDGQVYISDNHPDCLYCSAGYDAAYTAQN